MPDPHSIIVSLTTVDFRIEHMEPVIRSILDQEVQADRVVLYLSHEPYLLDKGIKPAAIPGFLKELHRRGKLEIHYTPNTGPYRKLLPILRDHRQDDCVIVTADDDTIYPTNWLKDLYSEFLARNVIIGSCGYSMRFRDQQLLRYKKWGTASANELLANFAIGKDGILYSPKFFDDWVDREDYLSIAPLADDIWFKCLTLRTGTGVFIRRPDQPMYPTVANPDQRCLWQTNRKSNDPQIRKTMAFFDFERDSFFSRLPS